MVWFKKIRGPEVLDLTYLQKRGLLEKSEEKTNSEVIDFTKKQDSNGDDFLSGLAGAGGSENKDSNYIPIAERLREARKQAKFGGSDAIQLQINQMKNMIETNEYKITELTNKIIELENTIKKVLGN